MELPYQLSPSLHKDDCTDARGECLSEKTTLKDAQIQREGLKMTPHGLGTSHIRFY
jgi:hypothetical protein